MNRARLAVAAAMGSVMIVAGGVALATRDSGGNGENLPAASDHDPATDYRVRYQVTTPDSTTSEDREVHRPFAAHITVRDAGGHVLSEQWSGLGFLVTRAAGSPAARLAVAAAPASGDLRLDRFTGELVQAGHLAAGKAGEVGGRPCTHSVETTSAATLPSQPGADITDAGDLTTLVDRCVDAQGILLQERWTTRGGTLLLTKRATSLSVGSEHDLAPPKAQALTPAQGNGSFRSVDPSEAPPFAETFRLPSPKGFTYVGRFAVVPPRVGTSSGGTATDAALALYTDVWTRGPDLLILDQGAGKNGATPFDDRTVLRSLSLERFGAAELAGDIRMIEVRLRRGDGGFVRLAGTIDPTELVELAQTIEPGGGAG